jgi:glutathione S-transferase
MDLYFSPLASSLAARIMLLETGLRASFIEVDPRTHQLPDGRDFREIYPLGLVPTLRTDTGALLSENVAVLVHIARSAGVLPTSPAELDRLHAWLAFIATEIHRGLFNVLFAADAPEAVRDYALVAGESRLAYLERQLTERSTLLDTFSIADAYLLTLLHMAQATPLKLSRWPAIHAYLQAGLARPSVRDAIAVELPLYLEEQKRLRAAS